MICVCLHDSSWFGMGLPPVALSAEGQDDAMSADRRLHLMSVNFLPPLMLHVLNASSLTDMVARLRMCSNMNGPLHEAPPSPELP